VEKDRKAQEQQQAAKTEGEKKEQPAAPADEEQAGHSGEGPAQ
jgi:hypothetical protein